MTNFDSFSKPVVHFGSPTPPLPPVPPELEDELG